jgi:hypothetical protein
MPGPRFRSHHPICSPGSLLESDSVRPPGNLTGDSTLIEIEPVRTRRDNRG